MTGYPEKWTIAVSLELNTRLVIFGGLLLPALVNARPDFFIEPSIEINEIYDDNIFISTKDKKSDLITRVSPGIKVGYDSSLLKINGSYSFDSEIYAENEQVNSWMMSQYGNTSIEYQPSRLLSMSVSADYTETQTPGELNLSSGLQVGRVNAQRISLSPAIAYRFSPISTGSLEYARSEDKLSGGIGLDAHEVQADFKHSISRRNKLSLGYTYNYYHFDNGLHQYSHIPRIGLSHSLGPRTDIIFEGGPSISKESIIPDISFSLAHDTSGGRFLLSYSRGETTLIGEAGRSESETVSASITHNFGRRLKINLTPSYSSVSRAGSEAHIFQAGVAVDYKINNVLSLSASYNYNLQQETLDEGNNLNMSRNVIMLGAVLTYPGRPSSRQNIN